jgi:hypothetical protein
MPSVVLVARDAAGRDLRDVHVTLDGGPLVDHLDAHAIPIDPGEHAFRFERGGVTVEERVMVREGEKARLLTVTVDAAPRAGPEPPAEPTATAPRSTNVATYIVGGLGLAALGAFGYFGLSGRSEYFDLEHSCAPHCTSSQTAPGRTKLIVADISLGVSVVALGVAAYMLLTRSSVTKAAPGAGRTHLDVQTSARGAVGSLGWVY